ncbi:hypothetical protein R1flu_013304 [Riccia fluitans]|uniref:Phytocyanin domain-containing protein n=1 Tax=Riccia fluitans TaxID=41844 RepID=A0ABD1YD05_9MARC
MEQTSSSCKAIGISVLEALDRNFTATALYNTPRMIMTSSWVAVCLILCFSSQLASAQEGETYWVGNSAGWTYINASSGKPADYSGWASLHQFYVNDILKFHYEPKKQSIYLFSKKEFWDTCDLANGNLLDGGTSGSYEWTLAKEGYYHFASGIHCDKGQKFSFFAVKNLGTGGGND